MSMTTEKQNDARMSSGGDPMEGAARPNPMQASAQPVLSVTEVSSKEPLVGTTGHNPPYDYPVPISKAK